MKKILSFILVLSVFVSFGTVAYAIGENPTGTTVGEVPSGETMNRNNGTVTTNSGTVTENNGTVTTNAATGTVTTNNGIVTTNNGLVTTNSGTVKDNAGSIETNEATGVVEQNEFDCAVKKNYGTVEENKGVILSNYEGAVVEENNGNVLFNRGQVSENNATVQSNIGTVVMASEDAIVSANYGTVEKGKIVTNADNSESIVYGSDTIYAVVYKESEEMISAVKNVVEGEEYSVMTEDEATAKNITRNGYKLIGWLDENTSAQYALGETITVDTVKHLSAIWNKIVEQVKFTYLKGDSNGKLEGKSFFFEKSASMIYSVKVNGKQLKEGVDYTVTEAEGGIQIEFTAEFFEKYAEGELNISVVFYDNVVFKVTAVNK